MIPTSSQHKDPILEALKGPVGKLCQDDIRLAIDPEKIWAYAEIRRNELYWRGNQYLDEVYSTDGNLIDYQPINGTWHQFTNDDDSAGMYATVINDFRGYGRKFIAVEAQQPPNVKAEPNDQQNEDHRRRAKKAQRVADKLHAGLWDVKRQNRKLFLTYYKNGTAFGHTVFVSDGEKYGYREEPVMEMRPTPLGPATLNCIGCGQQTPVENSATAPVACPSCTRPFGPEDLREPETAMLPQPTGEIKKYANGCVEHTVESGLRVTTQFNIEELTDTPFLLFEGERHKGKIFQAFPWLRDKFKAEGSGDAYGVGGTSTTSGQVTRDIASSPSGTYIAPRKNYLLFSEFWLRPTMYELAQGTVTLPAQEGSEEEPMDFSDALKKLYPTGLKVTMVGGDTVAKLEEARMDDEWNLSPPEPAENAYPDPLCKDYLDIQDSTNDYANIQKQTWERAIPQTMIDTRRIDTTFQAKYRQLPGSYIPVAGLTGGNLNDAVAKLPVATPEPEMERYAVEQREHGAEIIGITPQIYGGGASEQTAYATNLKRNQAMLQLSMAADAGREYWCDVTFNAVMLMAKHSNGTIPSPYAPATESETIEDIAELLEGGWHFEAADSMPMSWPEQREQLNKFMEVNAGNPGLLDKMGYFLPANIPKLQDTQIGIPDWKIPNEDALNKVNAEIRELLTGEPVKQPSVNLGEVIEIPSIPVDEFDDHAFVSQCLRDWFQTEQAMDIRKTNPAGFKNVVSFWKAHEGLAVQAAMKQAMQAEAAPPEEEKPEPGPGQLRPPAGGEAAVAPPVQ